MMRRLIPKHVEEKRRKKNQLTVGLVLIFIMFFSSISFGITGLGKGGGTNLGTGDGTPSNNVNLQTQNYNGFSFTNQNGFWFLNLEGVNYVFRHHPSDTLNIEGNLKTIEDYRGKEIYIYSEDNIAKSEITTNLAGIVSNVEDACHESIECSGNLEEKTCEENFIIIEIGERSITQENNCVFIKGDEKDLTKLSDEFLFKILGIK